MARVNVDIWHGKLDDALAFDEAFYKTFLDATEWEHAQGLSHVQVRKRYIEAHARLRLILAHYLKQAPASLRFATAEHGKPYLPDYPQLNFNLSHTSDYLAIALAEQCDLGVDIERSVPRKNLGGLVDKCFGEAEADYWRKLPEHMQLSSFFRFWTAKEAFVKATGEGISLGLNQCVLNIETWTAFHAVPKAYRPAADWFLRCMDLAEDIYGAVVIKSPRLRQPDQLSISAQPLFLL